LDRELRRLCTICARGGSKGVPGKNLCLIAGKPLIGHSIDQARRSGLFEAIAVSSDSEAILEAAHRCSADILVRRPNEMASDTAPKLPAIRHCVESAEAMLGRQFPIFVDLDATSPLRLPQDIIGAVRLLEERGVSNVITGSPARRSPYFNIVELDAGGFARLSKSSGNPIVRRQDAPRCYDMNASIYVWRRDVFFDDPAVFYQDTLLFEMPETRSIDIDSDLDLAIVRLLMEAQGPRSTRCGETLSSAARPELNQQNARINAGSEPSATRHS
jgi:N-acylneuraminate cytidylyltransferase/CMP-N,N'-diacetyllegionaminic acid synthase